MCLRFSARGLLFARSTSFPQPVGTRQYNPQPADEKTLPPTLRPTGQGVHLAWGCEDTETNWPGASAFQNVVLLAVAGGCFDSRRTCHSEWPDRPRSGESGANAGGSD